MEVAAQYAAGLGLEVWFSPYPMELDATQLLVHLADAATRAERLRGRGAKVVFVAGAEPSLFNRDFLPGDSPMERVKGLLNREPNASPIFRACPRA